MRHRLSALIVGLFLLLLFACLPEPVRAGIHCGDLNGTLYCTDRPEGGPVVVEFTEHTETLADFERYTPLGHQVVRSHRWTIQAPAPLMQKPKGLAPQVVTLEPSSCIGKHQHAWSNLPTSDCGGDVSVPGPYVVRDGTRIVPHSFGPPRIQVQLVP